MTFFFFQHCFLKNLLFHTVFFSLSVSSLICLFPLVCSPGSVSLPSPPSSFILLILSHLSLPPPSRSPLHRHCLFLIPSPPLWLAPSLSFLASPLFSAVMVCQTCVGALVFACVCVCVCVCLCPSVYPTAAIHHHFIYSYLNWILSQSHLTCREAGVVERRRLIRSQHRMDLHTWARTHTHTNTHTQTHISPLRLAL